MRTVTFNAGDTILFEGDVGDTAYSINRGSVEVLIGKGEKARSIGTLGVGEIFGEISLIDPGPRSATVKALTDTECVVTTYEELTNSFHEHPERAFEFMKTLAGRLRQMNQLVQTMKPGEQPSLRGMLNDWAAESYGNAQTALRQAMWNI